MDSKENVLSIKSKLNQLTDKIELEFAEEIFKNLNSLKFNDYSDEQIEELKEIYKLTGNKILGVGLNSKLNKYEEFESNINISKGTKSPTPLIEDKDDFDDVLKTFIEKEFDLIKHIKGFFLLKMETGTPNKTDILFLYDDNLKSAPHLTRFIRDFKNIEDYCIKDFVDTENYDKRYFVILYISENINESKTTINNISIILKKFNSISYYEYDKDKNQYIHIGDNELLQDIENYSTKIFNNQDFSQEEEILIKKLFAKNSAILNYKTLKSGFSGVKVIEVQSVKSVTFSERKVVKVHNKISKKISDEIDSFRNSIRELGIKDYDMDHEHTTTLEAILYKYASTDGFTDSYSFNEIVKDNILKKNKLNINFDKSLKVLFESEPFKTWKDKNNIVSGGNKLISDLYKDYIDTDKSYNQLKNIINDDILSIQLLSQINSLFKQKILVKTKYCHGDLHTENIFHDKDEKVYLIDFGWTGIRHSIIDHAFLESSLKFNHIPRYIPISELIEIENNFNIPDSFNDNLDLSFIKREELKKIYNWILKIRSDAKNFLYDDSKNNEYYISLIIIAYRMILFNDLYQQFAYKSLEQLLKIVI